MLSSFKRTLKSLTTPAIALLLFLFLVAFMLSVSPSDTNFMVSFVPLALVWGILFSSFLSFKLFLKEERKKTLRFLSAVAATLGTLVLMFSALGQLALFDVSLLVLLAVLGVFYFRRSWSK